jgi:hypothetical protein
MKQDDTAKSDWLDKGRADDVYYRMQHKPCGTTVLVQMGQAAVCPKCQPDEWSRQRSEHAKK